MSEFERRHERWKASHFQPVIINSNEPIGIMWFGDPHVDDNGCNWPQLLKDIEIAKQPGVYGVNIGDTTNNWVGRLVKKYAEQETTRTNAWRLCEWFLNDAGIPWLFWLLGNHDVWNDGAEIMKRMNIQKVLMHDWMAS
ncbi:MAG: metallophosphoesterase, partial [Pseudomonadota bacterium]